MKNSATIIIFSYFFGAILGKFSIEELRHNINDVNMKFSLADASEVQPHGFSQEQKKIVISASFIVLHKLSLLRNNLGTLKDENERDQYFDLLLKCYTFYLPICSKEQKQTIIRNLRRDFEGYDDYMKQINATLVA